MENIYFKKTEKAEWTLFATNGLVIIFTVLGNPPMWFLWYMSILISIVFTFRATMGFVLFKTVLTVSRLQANLVALAGEAQTREKTGVVERLREEIRKITRIKKDMSSFLLFQTLHNAITAMTVAILLYLGGLIP